MNNQVQYINPDGLFKNPAFSQIVTTQGSGKTIYIGGQNAVMCMLPRKLDSLEVYKK